VDYGYGTSANCSRSGLHHQGKQGRAGVVVALTAAEEAKYALDYGVSWLELSLGAQIEYDQLVAGGYGAPPLAVTTWLPSLGVALRDGNVYQYGVDQRGIRSGIRAMSERAARTEMKLLGPLAGAHAEVLSAPSRRGFEMFATFSFADETVVDKKFDKKSMRASLLIRAQGEVARFNVLAASSQPAEGFAGGAASDSAEGSAQDDTGIATELGAPGRSALPGLV
jgi:hypothetical protein